MRSERPAGQDSQQMMSTDRASTGEMSIWPGEVVTSYPCMPGTP